MMPHYGGLNCSDIMRLIYQHGKQSVRMLIGPWLKLGLFGVEAH